MCQQHRHQVLLALLRRRLGTTRCAEVSIPSRDTARSRCVAPAARTSMYRAAGQTLRPSRSRSSAGQGALHSRAHPLDRAYARACSVEPDAVPLCPRSYGCTPHARSSTAMLRLPTHLYRAAHTGTSCRIRSPGRSRRRSQAPPSRGRSLSWQEAAACMHPASTRGADRVCVCIEEARERCVRVYWISAAASMYVSFLQCCCLRWAE
jgi:hypothetical protein